MGKPKKVKRAYHRKVVQEVKEESSLAKEEVTQVKLEEKPMEIPQPAKQHQLFFNLEEARIGLEESERQFKEKNKKLVEQTEAEKRKINTGKPKLICPFCQHIQFSINSRDITSAWCEVCGRCFQASWR